MNDILNLLTRYKSLGILLSLDKTGQHISIKGRIDLLSAADKEELSKYKPDIIRFFSEQQHARQLYSPIGKVAPAGDYPVSPAQRRLWILSQLEEVSVAHNMPMKVQLQGEYHITYLKQAIMAVVERHEILRTVFVQNSEGEVRQKVLSVAALQLHIHYHDYRQYDDAAARTAQLIASDTGTPFNLAAGPLLRCYIIRQPGRELVFYYNMHHIISDAWSVNILANEVQQGYQTLFNGAALTPAPLRIQYKDYAAWQLQYLKSTQAEQDRNYWHGQFAERLVPLHFSVASNRPPVKTYNGHSLGIYLSTKTTAGFNSFVQQQGASTFIGLITVLRILLYRYTNNTAVTIGASVAGREHPDLDGLIGFFTNAIALRTKIDPEESFTTLLGQVSAQVLEAYKHQQYPFDYLVDELAIKRDLSRHPLYDVMMSLQHSNEVRLASAPQDVASGVLMDLGKIHSKLDMSFVWQERGDRLYLTVIYNTDLYPVALMESLISHYVRLLNVLLSQPERPVGQIPFLPEEEQFRGTAYEEEVSAVTTAYVAPVTAVEKTLVEIFEEVLNKKGIGVEDNFFAIGGNSIKATIVLSKIDQLFNQRIDVMSVFTNPTVSFFAREIEAGLLKQEMKQTTNIQPVKKIII